MDKGKKLLGRGTYGHIPHLIGSKLGCGDHHISIGQTVICTIKLRDCRDVVITEEKFDGSCVAVARKDEVLIPLTRSGYVANSSKWTHHHWFYNWVFEHIDQFGFLREGERLVGEWLAQAHGTRYNLDGRLPFVPFDIISETNGVVPYKEFIERLPAFFPRPKVLSYGAPCSIAEADELLGEHGYYGAIEKAEGVVYRVERDGKLDFRAKWVRPEKIAGKYLDQDLYNWSPYGGYTRW